MAPAILLTTVISGCRGTEDDEGPPVRATHEFKGTADPAYVGNWVDENKMSTLDLKEDGTASIVAVQMSASGRNESKLSGEWKVDPPSLLLRYKAGGEDVTLKYAAKLNGDALELVQAGNNHKNNYHRKK